MTSLFIILLSVFSTSSLATNYSVTASSQGNPTTCANSSEFQAVTCTTMVAGHQAGGTVTSNAGFAIANVSLLAVCSAVGPCVLQQGTATSAVDLAIHGKPAGTIGLIEIDVLAYAPDWFGTATASINGLSQYSPNPVHTYGGSLYQFVYEQPFQLRGDVRMRCTECEAYGFARFKGLYIYDMDLNLLGQIERPEDALHTPEPTTLLTTIGAVLSLLAVNRRR